ncbi:MAG: nuclease-related domain-containing protein [Chloroflexota bacterium]
MPPQKRSPITDPLLHNPGQTLDKQIQQKWDNIFTYLMFCVSGVVIVVSDWETWLTQKIHHPLPATILAAAIMAFCIYKMVRTRREISRLTMARDGEMAIGQFLDGLRRADTQVFHDIPAEGFNLDHVLISPQGVYVIETKTYSKPLKGKAVIRVQDDQVLANGQVIERNPLEQARGEARWLQELLQKSTGKKFPVRAVVLFLNWFVEPAKGHRDVWVLNQKALPAFLAKEPRTMALEDVYLVSYHLTRYVGAKDKR